MDVGGWQRDVEELELKLKLELEVELEEKAVDDVGSGLVESAEEVDNGLGDEFDDELVEPVVVNKSW